LLVKATESGLAEKLLVALGPTPVGQLAPGGMAAAQQWLVQTWDTVLAAYAAEISRLAQPAEEPRSSPRVKA
jgi:hypothetical protein